VIFWILPEIKCTVVIVWLRMISGFVFHFQVWALSGPSMMSFTNSLPNMVVFLHLSGTSAVSPCTGPELQRQNLRKPVPPVPQQIKISKISKKFQLPKFLQGKFLQLPLQAQRLLQLKTSPQLTRVSLQPYLQSSCLRLQIKKSSFLDLLPEQLKWLKCS
jgi:hypothetical protein